MDTGELASVLKDAGLSPYQADTYVALLDLGSASARDIADASGVPSPRIYDVLRDLEDKGYVATYEQDQLYARANNPAEALGELRTQVGRVETAIEEIESRWHEPEEHDYEVSLVRRFQTVFTQAEKAIQNATYQVQLSVTPAYFQDLQPILREAHERGVLIQLLLYTPSDDEIHLDLTDFDGVCSEARRRAPCWDESFEALVDGQKVFFAWYHDLPNEYGVIVDDPGQQFIFWFYFTSLWDISEKLYTSPTESLPMSFVEIRDCIREVEPLLREHTMVKAQIKGYEVSTGRQRELTGTITDIQYVDSKSDESISPVQLAGQATLILQTNRDAVTIGGTNAATEDVAADLITIEGIHDHSS
ncbi:TrmB family transcriptional regulator [Haladaptatus halobius]|uniref:TrmB family transcriptional regulator n=1 Tax=Haladaptatus halobius TaxID=2884875 RepID=UPI001D09ED26|nr:TrmB family transcriptional regulator [Haladaptatus halobius]